MQINYEMGLMVILLLFVLFMIFRASIAEDAKMACKTKEEREAAERKIEQNITVHILPSKERPGKRIVFQFEATTSFYDGLMTYSAEESLSMAREEFVRTACKYGVRNDNHFYPHSRIDKIEYHGVVVIKEGMEDKIKPVSAII